MSAAHRKPAASVPLPISRPAVAPLVISGDAETEQTIGASVASAQQAFSGTLAGAQTRQVITGRGWLIFSEA